MKRDMELIRKILFYVDENYVAGQTWIYSINIEGYDDDMVTEHIILAYESGLLQDIKNASTFSEPSCWVGNLSNAGYDFLDKIRSDTIWNRTKATIKEKGLPMLTGTISMVANGFISAVAEGVVNSIVEK